MSHSTIEQLTDYLLAPDGGEVDQKVGDHLATGCERCHKLLAALSYVRRVGQSDAVNQPPEAVLRTVKALGGFSRPRRRFRPVKMRLSFDSLLDACQLGARSLHASSRHLVFYSQNFALDLRMDYERSVRDMVVVGQLLNRDWGPLSDIPAYLVSGDDVLSHSKTGRLGEFHMECRPRGPLHLRLVVNDEELIDVELDRRQQEGPRPVLVDQGDLPGSRSVPDSIHSRSADSEHREQDPKP